MMSEPIPKLYCMNHDSLAPNFDICWSATAVGWCEVVKATLKLEASE